MAIKIFIMNIYSRFKGTDLPRSMLANFFMPHRRDRGAMAAMGRRWPPWSGCICLPSFHLANRVQRSSNPKTNKNPTTDRPDISINIWLNGTFEVPILCASIGWRWMCCMVTQIRHLGVGGARWRSGCHGWIVFCVHPSYFNLGRVPISLNINIDSTAERFLF